MNVKKFLKSITLDQVFKITVILGILTIAGSITYHYFVFLPQKERIRLKQAEQERSEKERKEKEQQIFRQWVNSCIIEAQRERDRRKLLVTQALLKCGPELGVDYCNKLKKESEAEIEKMYEEWVENCKRGIPNIFPKE